MNKYVHYALTAILLLFMAEPVFAQSFTATYPFTAVASGSGGRTDATPAPVVPGVTFGAFSAVAPAANPNLLGSAPNAGGRFSFIGWPTGATTASNNFTGTINTEQYYEVTITPQANIELNLDSINFTSQRSGTGIRQYSVRSSVDNYAANLPASVSITNPSLQVVNDNIFQVDDAATGANDGNKLTLSGITGLQNRTTAVTFRFYGWNAEAPGGTFSIDNVSFSGKTVTVAGSPVITLSTALINYSPVNINTTSAAVSFTVQGENLTAPVTITTSAPFSVSDAENGNYATTLIIPATDVASAKMLYLKFTPSGAIAYNGLVNITSGVASKDIAVTGEGTDPANLAFTFNNCSSGGGPGSGFISYSSTGAQRWACSNFGNNATRGIDVNGFAGGVALDNEDWLISPALVIGSLDLPVLSFYTRGEFAGPSLQLLISTDYDGSSNPATANWTDLQANFPPLTNTWTFIDGINLTAYKSFPKIYIAFKYTSSPELGAARWTLDDIGVNDRSKLLSVTPAGFNFGEITAGNSSGSQTITFQSIGYGDLTITAPPGYELSADNITFNASVNVGSAVVESGTTLYARFSPTSKSLKWEGKIRFTGTALDSSILTLTGSSYPKAETFDAGAYNLSFFGSNPTNNPTPQKIAT